jgi:hypothetical protein
MNRTIALFREANWLTPDRALAWSRVLLVVTVLGALVWVALARGGIDLAGKPLGTDFVSFWTASELALNGHPEAAYDPVRHQHAQIALFSGIDATGYTAFFYPPVFLLLCLPLAALPYLWALAAWLGVTFWAFWRAARVLLPQSEMIAGILAYPAVLVNLGHGQNGFLSAALFGGGMLALDARPALAGICLGCLAFKPHLALLVPVALVAGGRWRPLAAAGMTAVGLVAASVAVFGTETWRAFLADSSLARRAMEQNLIGPEKMQSAFAAVRLLGGGVTASYAAQIAALLLACVLVTLHARSVQDGQAEGAALATASLFGSPFVLDYDLTILALPFAWVMRHALATRFLPWEKITLLAGFVLPLVSRTVAARVGVPLGPAVILAVLGMVLRRSFVERAGGIAPRDVVSNS